MSVSTDGKEVEQVRFFIYLGSSITDDGWCELEIKKKIGIAKSQFLKLRNMFTYPELGLRH